LTSWLRRILAHNLANVVRHYCGTQGGMFASSGNWKRNWSALLK
jgi:hypothetical protein